MLDMNLSFILQSAQDYWELWLLIWHKYYTSLHYSNNLSDQIQLGNSNNNHFLSTVVLPKSSTILSNTIGKYNSPVKGCF